MVGCWNSFWSFGRLFEEDGNQDSQQTAQSVYNLICLSCSLALVSHRGDVSLDDIELVAQRSTVDTSHLSTRLASGVRNLRMRIAFGSHFPQLIALRNLG